MGDIDIRTPDGKPLLIHLGRVVHTVAEAEERFVETVARLMWERDYHAARQQDEDDRDAIADALMHTLGIDLNELYTRHKPQITELYQRWRDEGIREEAGR